MYFNTAMDTIKINTTQNVALDYTAAGVGNRLLAIIIDTVIKYAYVSILLYILFNTGTNSLYKYDYDGNETVNVFVLVLLIIILIPFTFYHLLSELFLNGQSIGKRIMKIKVVKLNGTQPSIGSYIARSMFRIIDDSIVGLITIAVSKNSQRFGDMAAGTTVIELAKKVTLRDTILSLQESDYQIVYSQVALMNDTDINTIKEVLDFHSKQNQPKLLEALASKIKTKYAIQSTAEDNWNFLNTLLKDYSHYQFEK